MKGNNKKFGNQQSAIGNFLIDVHAHFFPDSIAEKAVETLKHNAKQQVQAYGHNMATLKKEMEEDGVDISINQPVATKPEQVVSINRKMIETNLHSDGKIICFGAMHPDFDKIGNIHEELEFIAESGIKGIKLHPDYMGFYPDEERAYKIYDACRKNNLIILFHAGVDLAYEDVHSTPKRFAEVTKISGLKFIIAHMGGYRQWDDVIKYLAGKDVYLDTAYTAEMKDEQFKDIVDAQGQEKILFGTDFPWERASNIKKKIEKAINEKEIREKIYYKNAKKLLNI